VGGTDHLTGGSPASRISASQLLTALQPPTTHARSTVVAVRSRLPAVVVLVLALALLAGTTSLLGSSQHISGAPSAASTAASFDDDRGDLGDAIPLLSFLVVSLLLPLGAAALPSDPHPEEVVGGTHRARAPPSG
jgi:hypothetical protein